MSADRNLLAGILALQMDFVSGEQLLDAMNAWTLKKQTPLLDVLRERGALSAEDVDAVSRLVERHVARHGGDAAKSLAAVRIDPAVAERLAGAGDAEVRKSLAGRPARDPYATSLPTGPSPAGSTVRYQRRREHARGGLGEVFVAEDTELHRDVALKEIQAGLADYPDMRARFVREAVITGQLEHPGVVPVYGLGVYDDGRPYYAMRFIGGESMDATIRRYHRGGGPVNLRALLNRFVAMCYAVAYAHSRGIIHRDLKPNNVMLGEYGETLVVDWGLARRLAEKENETRADRPVVLNGEESATREGEAVGTPAYMSPEQARGRLEEVGPCSDIFALGATLYAILTGQPPYTGSSVLREAATCEPVPPRQVKRGVPAALDAVCRKAMAKEPKDRYGSARELAAEVERWLADEPVSAYRDPLSVRVLRWGRRHRTLVTSLAVLLVVGTAALAVGLAVVNSERVRTKANLDRALKAEEDAEASLKVADANLKLAREAVDECFNVAKDDPLFQGGGMLPARKLLLSKTLRFYRAFQDVGGGHKQLDWDEAAQLERVGYITAEMGKPDEALQAYGKAEVIRQRLADAHQDDLVYLFALASVRSYSGDVLKDMGKYEQALAAYGKAEALWRRLVDARPDSHGCQAALASTLNNTCNVLKDMGKRDEALARYGHVAEIWQNLADAHPAVPDYQANLASVLGNMGPLLMEAGRIDPALNAYRRAEAAQQKLADAYPTVPRYHFGLASTLINMSGLLRQTGNVEGTVDANRRAEAVMQRLADAHPAVPQYQNSLATTIFNTGNQLGDQGRHEDALKAYGRAEVIQRRLADVYPAVPDYSSGLAKTLENVGFQLQAQGKHEEALKAYGRGEAVRRRLVDAHPAVLSYQSGLANTVNNTGLLLATLGRNGEAQTAFSRAGELYSRLHAVDAANPEYRFRLAIVHYLQARLRARNVVAANAKPRSGSLRQQEADKLAREVLHHLRIAKQHGAFRNLQVRDEFATDPDFAALRERADFKAFVASLPK